MKPIFPTNIGFVCPTCSVRIRTTFDNFFQSAKSTCEYLLLPLIVFASLYGTRYVRIRQDTESDCGRKNREIFLLSTPPEIVTPMAP